MVMQPSDVPNDLWLGICEFWPDTEWINATNIARLENPTFDPFAINNSADKFGGCGIPIGAIGGVPIVTERSIGPFQVNACLFPTWEWQRLYNTRHNCGTAHLIWTLAGNSWRPWLLSATKLGLI